MQLLVSINFMPNIWESRFDNTEPVGQLQFPYNKPRLLDVVDRVCDLEKPSLAREDGLPEPVQLRVPVAVSHLGVMAAHNLDVSLTDRIYWLSCYPYKACYIYNKRARVIQSSAWRQPLCLCGF